MNSSYSLVGDIGGTNARFALVLPGSIELQHIRQYPVADYQTLEAAIYAYLNDLEIDLGAVHRVCIAAAGPVSFDLVQLTNSPWQIDKRAMKHALGLDEFVLINDFAAQAMAVPFLQPQQLERIGPEVSPPPCDSLLVIGPGTGLGFGSLVRVGEHWKVCPSEGGNTDFAPQTEDDLYAWRYLKESGLQAIGWERLLSGSGLEMLYKIHSHRAGLNDKLAAPQITQTALEDSDSLCAGVVRHFCTLLARCAANGAMVTGAQGGVYIAGGIVPRIRTMLDHQAFRDAFDLRDKIPGYVSCIPIWLVLAEYPGLTGAAAFLANE